MVNRKVLIAQNFSTDFNVVRYDVFNSKIFTYGLSLPKIFATVAFKNKLH